jgi:N utilization substance protein B
MSDDQQRPERSGHARTQRRRAARLAACQALYEMEVSGASADAALRGFFPNRWNIYEDEDGVRHDNPMPEPDGDLLCDVVRGVVAHRGALEGMIGGALAESWSNERLEILMRVILHAGAFELLARKDVPVRVVISEYVEVAKAFFAGTEPGMVNAVLDRLGRVLRADEMGGEGGDAPPADR